MEALEDELLQASGTNLLARDEEQHEQAQGEIQRSFLMATPSIIGCGSCNVLFRRGVSFLFSIS